MKSFEEKGIWWLPEHPDTHFSGILKFDPMKGVNLEIAGSFENGLIEFFFDEKYKNSVKKLENIQDK